MPWKVDGDTTYNPAIPKLFSAILPKRKGANSTGFSSSDELIPYLTKEIFRNNCRGKLYELAPLQFQKEIDEVKRNFEVINVQEYPFYGRYISSGGQNFRFTLKHPSLYSNVYLQYFLSRKGNSLYPRDSLLKNFDSIRNRIQNIKFLMDYVQINKGRRSDFFYFNSSAITPYHIDGFNKNPQSWKQHEQWVKGLEFYKTSGIKPSFDLNESIVTSRQVNCGCNFRMDNKYLENSLFFELMDEEQNSSIWLLLPDNTPVLWYFQGSKVFNYTSEQLGTKGVGVQYACEKFNQDGTIQKD
jgi:hypothetical protein